jgi:hypothetical protein
MVVAVMVVPVRVVAVVIIVMTIIIGRSYWRSRLTRSGAIDRTP